MTPSAEGKTRTEIELQARAGLALNEYLLVKSGAARLTDLGHVTDDGRPLEFNLREFTIIEGLIAQANKDKSERGKHS